MWIVKIGGSLHDAANLRDWLSRLATMPGAPRIVVPGGGPFADAVRELQERLGYGEVTAHRLAILAMQQYGLHLHGLEPRLTLAQSEAELRAARACIWLPWAFIGLEESIEASWDVTSDSLACWLAARLGAQGLLLVKSAPLPIGQSPHPDPPPRSAREGVRGTAGAAPFLAVSGGGWGLPGPEAADLLDPAFPAYARRLKAPIWLASRDDLAALDLLSGTPSAAPLTPP